MLSEVNDSLYSKKENSILNVLLNIVIVIIAVLLIFEIVFGFSYSGIYVVGSSMTPTLVGAESENVTGGDYVYINKHTEPTYGDIVVIDTEDLNGFGEQAKCIIKRVIAFGGDTIKLDNGTLWIKYGKTSSLYTGEDEFVPLIEDYVDPTLNTGHGNEPITFPLINGKLDEAGHCVAEGCFFLMGDNRDYSYDSRRRGDFELERLVGVVTEWSQTPKNKKFFTSLHQYFTFDLPRYFGLKK